MKRAKIQKRRRNSILTVALLGFLTVTFSSLWNETRFEQIFGHETVYFYNDPSVEPLPDYQNAFAVGHNAGSSVLTVGQARSSGAKVIEIDVVLLGDTLVSAHVPQMRVIGSWVFRGPTLERVWNEAGADVVIQLDLKQSDSRFRSKVIEFLTEHAGEQTVLVATRDVTMLDMLREKAPDVLRFMSVADAFQLAAVVRNEDLAKSLDGVTIRWQLVNQFVVDQLKDLDLIVLAWTVNDLKTVNEFVAMGVDGFSTNNLGIMEVLSTPNRDSALRFLRTAEPTLPNDDPAPE